MAERTETRSIRMPAGKWSCKRPGRENQVADYLSRNPGLNYDETVNQEEQFEYGIFSTNDSRKLYERIREEQIEDPMINRALTEFLERERVRSGQLRRISHKLQFVEGNLLFEGRIVTPKHLR